MFEEREKDWKLRLKDEIFSVVGERENTRVMKSNERIYW